jgi:hypothetical protein
VPVLYDKKQAISNDWKKAVDTLCKEAYEALYKLKGA